MKAVTDPSILALVSGGAPAEAIGAAQIIGESTVVGVGWGTSKYLVRVGGWAGVPDAALGATAGAFVAGAAAAGIAGYQAGTFLYDNVEWVRDGSLATVTFTMDGIKSAFNFVSEAFFSGGAGLPKGSDLLKYQCSE